MAPAVPPPTAPTVPLVLSKVSCPPAYQRAIRPMGMKLFLSPMPLVSRLMLQGLLPQRA